MYENLDVESLDRATADAIEVVRIIGVLTGHFAFSVLAAPVAPGENLVPALFQRLWTILERTGPVVEEADAILSIGAPGDTCDLEIDIPDKPYEAEWKSIFASEVPSHNAHAAALGLATQFFHAALWWLVGVLRPGLLRVPETVPNPGTVKWKEMVEGFVRVWSHRVPDCRMFPWLRNPSALLGRIQREHSSALRALQKAVEAGHPGTPVVWPSSSPSAERTGHGETGGTMEGLRSFIVHGHDENAKLALKNYLQNAMKWPEPVILAEKPSGGKTITEKFEEHSKNIDVVFVLLTPDDMGGAVGGPLAARARQNVILELGYFAAKFGRSSGRVILLHKGDLELPSDMAGIIYIDISNGVEAAGENIHREVATLVRIN